VIVGRRDQIAALSQEILELDFGVGFVVAVFYYDGRVERNPPFFSLASSDGA
jgi:hypothetical protein